MSSVTIKLNETEEKTVNVLKALKGLSSKEKAIKYIINDFGTQMRIKEMVDDAEKKW